MQAVLLDVLLLISSVLAALTGVCESLEVVLFVVLVVVDIDVAR